MSKYRYVTDNPADPVVVNDEGYWFWDETWSDIHGPFPSEEVARKELELYAATLEPLCAHFKRVYNESHSSDIKEP